MKTIFKAVSLAAILLILAGCNSMKVESTVGDQRLKSSIKDLSIYDFNKKFEKAINNKNIDFIKKTISSESIIKHLKKEYLPEYADVALLYASRNKSDKSIDLGHIFKSNIVKVLNNNPNNSNWTYLYSLYNKDSELTMSLYRIIIEDRLQYIKFYFDEDRKLVNLHVAGFKYSDFDLMINLMALPLRSVNKINHHYDTILKFTENAKNSDMDKLESDFKNLDYELKNSDIFYDFLLKLQLSLKKEPAKKFVILMQEYMLYQSFLLHPYLEHSLDHEAFEKRRLYLENLLDFTQNDSNALSELSLTYARKGDFLAALKLGKQAIMKSPEDEDIFWDFLEVTILSGRFDLSTKVLRVLNEKFQIQLNEENLSELKQYPDFINSEIYTTWLTAIRISKSQ